MASKRKNDKFSAFAADMATALSLGHKDRLALRVPATPVELGLALDVEARSMSMLYLREAYLAGYNYVSRD